MAKNRFLVGYLKHPVIVTAVRRPEGCLVLKQGEVVELDAEQVKAVLEVCPKGVLGAAPEVEVKDPVEEKTELDPFEIPPPAVNPAQPPKKK